MLVTNCPRKNDIEKGRLRALSGITTYVIKTNMSVDAQPLRMYISPEIRRRVCWLQGNTILNCWSKLLSRCSLDPVRTICHLPRLAVKASSNCCPPALALRSCGPSRRRKPSIYRRSICANSKSSSTSRSMASSRPAARMTISPTATGPRRMGNRPPDRWSSG